MNRRDFLSSTLAGAALLAPSAYLFNRPTWAATSPVAGPRKLTIASRTLDINGKSAKVFGLIGPDGKPGLDFDAGGTFDVSLINALDEPTLIHWHGLTPPWADDGVPDNPAAQLKPGETRAYAFPVGPGGTHWMHAHTLQEQNLLAAPLIVRTAEDRRRDEQEVVILLHDFSFTPAAELLAKLTGTPAVAGNMPMAHMNHMMPGTNQAMPMMNHDMPGMNHPMPGMAMPAPGGMQQMMPGMMGAMDVNDIDYDAYLANDRTLADPEVTQVEKGGRVRLRIINGATSTAFTVTTGALGGELVAVDGQEIEPVGGSAFPISMGQRLDIRLSIPKDGGAFPILALREGAPERAGIVLATAGAAIKKLAIAADTKGPILDAGLEPQLRAIAPLAKKAADLQARLTLTGSMAGYTWAIDGGDLLKVKRGQRVEVSMVNMSMMTHPMHLHGHHFQVIGINGRPISGAVRDTVFIPHMGEVTVAFDADNPGRWPLHCHHLYHMATGMMTFVTYDQLG
ncbi:MAG: multicopper oxidase domain-containing protein [Ancalomicrobiaceae bacterium]|nr:multicopper oxidase domain-containing protein [Ancalomicrobiaceae bacterium]